MHYLTMRQFSYGIIFAQALGMKVVRKVDKPEYKVEFLLTYILALYLLAGTFSCVSHYSN